MSDHGVIDLAHEKPFRLGPVSVRPAIRELARDDGRRETLEPRVMQVLVALARVGGEILTRDDLTECCWEGRIVGEDAINRVISRLRRTAEGIGLDAFRIETITKVGYRLIVEGEAGAVPATDAAVLSVAQPSAQAPAPTRWSRRVLLAAGAGGVALAAAGAAFVLSRPKPRPALDPATQAAYDQGWTALHNTLPDQVAQAIGLFRRVVEAAPGYADGWGALGYAYAAASKNSDPSNLDAFQAGARSAAQRALQLEPHNALAEATLANLTPILGNWSEQERTLRAALARHPQAVPLSKSLAWLLISTGRAREAAQIDAQTIPLEPPSPAAMFRRVVYLWAANRLEEAERTSRVAMETFPRNTYVWFTSFFFYLYTGRPAQAIAQGLDIAGRPSGLTDEDFDTVLTAAQAVQSRAAADIDRAMAVNFKWAHTGRGYAENALQFAAFLGRLDLAFQIADAYYFGRGFKLGRRSFSRQAAAFYPEPRTYVLFLPSTAALRADPRFEGLVDELGLKAFWARSGRPPDYAGG